MNDQKKRKTVLSRTVGTLSKGEERNTKKWLEKQHSWHDLKKKCFLMLFKMLFGKLTFDFM